MAMQYKTNPQGKPRVYFCCHPKDFEAYFETVSNEILHIQECAIWYDLSNTPLDEERRLDLGQMQLFVMPITTKLLTTPNVALSEEFPFAIQNHIPVLPIMMEGKLEELFNKKCGNLHFLDKTAHDPTVIGYEEKLKKYLSSVLVGDELADKVRCAFDARIFLSYRRDDRKNAQQLMRLIHQNDLFRDIAIWYDEYLLPGENFNTAIEDMIQRSDLIVLAVTPNLLEIPNYALMREYPEAKAAQKPILPVEVGSIDPNILKQIPTCVHKGDQQQLSAALLDLLQQQKIVLRENNSDPQHNFLIGLAYLNGIDVEVNHAMAQKLITGAAEADLPEAVKKLAEMYHAGMGVERDCREAVRWQKKSVDLCIDAYRQEKNEEHGHTLVCEYWILVDFAVEAGDLSVAQHVCGEMLSASLAVAESYQIVSACRGLSFSSNKLGDLFLAEGDLLGARMFYAEDFSRFLAEETGTVWARRDLSVCCEKLGDLCKAGGDRAQARKYYGEALELRRRLAEETGTVEAQRDLSVSCNNLGDLDLAEGDRAQARKYYGEALELRRRLAEETGTVEAQRDLSISCNNLGDLYLAEGDRAQARKYYGEALELRRHLAEETGTVEAQRDLSISCEKLGDLCKAEGDLAQVGKYYVEALELRRRLAEKTDTPQAWQDLLIICGKLGDLYLAEGNLTRAREYYREGLGLRRCLAEETGIETRRNPFDISCKVRRDIEAQRDLLVSCGKLGDIVRVESDLAQTESNLAQTGDVYQYVLDLSRRLAEETGMAEARRHLSVICGVLGNDFMAKGNLARAGEYYKEGLKLCRLAEETGTAEARRDMLVICSKLGDLCQVKDDLAQAKEYYHEALGLSRRLAKETGTIEARRDLSIICEKLGDLSQEKGDLVQARECYQEDLELSRRLAEETGAVQSYHELAGSYINIAFVSQGDEKRDMLTQASNIWKRLNRKHPEAPEFRQALNVLEKIFDD